MAFNVLIVEDSKLQRELIAEWVAAIPGVVASSTGSGFGALKLLPRKRFDLIITDLNLPDINALELINFVKKNPNYRHTPLVIITSSPKPDDREKALDLGASDFLIKPLQPSDVGGLIRRYLPAEDP